MKIRCNYCGAILEPGHKCGPRYEDLHSLLVWLKDNTIVKDYDSSREALVYYSNLYHTMITRRLKISAEMEEIYGIEARKEDKEAWPQSLNL